MVEDKQFLFQAQHFSVHGEIAVIGEKNTVVAAALAEQLSGSFGVKASTSITEACAGTSGNLVIIVVETVLAEKDMQLVANHGKAAVIALCSADYSLEGNVLALRENIFFCRYPLFLSALVQQCFYVVSLLNKEVAVMLSPHHAFYPSTGMVVDNAAVSSLSVQLTEKESALLYMLCNTTKLMSKKDLLKSLWGYNDEIDTHTLETHIYRLRQKVPLLQECIIHKENGYCFIRMEG